MLAPLVSQQQGAGSPSMLLTVAGLDVTDMAPLDFGVTITEQSPGSVSSMMFTIEDTTGAVTVNDDDAVVCWDTVRDVPRFSGFVTTRTIRPMPQAAGRWIDVQATGIDALLDWMTGPALFVAASAPHNIVATVYQMLLAQAQWTGGVAIRSGVDPVNAYGSATFPIGQVLASAGAFAADTTIPAGTLRSQLRYAKAQGYPVSGMPVTVDMYGGLRAWKTSLVNNYTELPSDWSTLTVSDTASGTAQAESMAYTVDANSVVRSVQVFGGSAAGSGVFSDGTGRPGLTAQVTDSSSTTALQAAGDAFVALLNGSSLARGAYTLTAVSPLAGWHAGGTTTITDANCGLASAVFTIGSIAKSLLPAGLETWTVTFGAAAPSYVDKKGRT